jgi:hypothetical protein
MPKGDNMRTARVSNATTPLGLDQRAHHEAAVELGRTREVPYRRCPDEESNSFH